MMDDAVWVDEYEESLNKTSVLGADKARRLVAEIHKLRTEVEVHSGAVNDLNEGVVELEKQREALMEEIRGLRAENAEFRHESVRLQKDRHQVMQEAEKMREGNCKLREELESMRNGVVQGKTVERERIVEYLRKRAWQASALGRVAAAIENREHWDG